jgi:hypothetical protein
MTCQLSKERMIDVLYDEGESPIQSAEFFRHLDGCPSCRSDFLGLMQARQWLGAWDIEEEEAAAPTNLRRASGFNWWSGVQKLAASVLIVVGAVSILRGTGLWGDRLSVSERQLMEMVTDIVVSRQADHELQIGHALQSVVDSAGLEAFYQQNLGQRLQVLEESILQAGEERDRILQRLAFQ